MDTEFEIEYCEDCANQVLQLCCRVFDCIQDAEIFICETHYEESEACCCDGCGEHMRNSDCEYCNVCIDEI